MVNRIGTSPSPVETRGRGRSSKEQKQGVELIFITYKHVELFLSSHFITTRLLSSHDTITSHHTT